MASPPVFGRKGSSCDAPPALARRCRRLALIRFYGRGEWGEPGTPAGMYRAHEAAGMKTARVEPDPGIQRAPIATDPPRRPAASLRSRLFTTTGETAISGWSKAKGALEIASGVKDWRLHDLRRTMATNLQKLGVRLEVTEAVLNHISGSHAGIVGVYQRHAFADEKRDALDKWAARVAVIAGVL
jgi:integrase